MLFIDTHYEICESQAMMYDAKEVLELEDHFDKSKIDAIKRATTNFNLEKWGNVLTQPDTSIPDLYLLASSG